MKKPKPKSTVSIAPQRWRIRDSVTGLREWAGDRVYQLPTSLAPGEHRGIGSLPSSWLHLSDPSVSRHHANLFCRDGEWVIEDDYSKNGLLIDGVGVHRGELLPGAVVGIGDVELVAETELLRKLRQVLSRLLGWSPTRMGVVDQALSDIRSTTNLHLPLRLSADSGLNSIAKLLHDHVIGEERPFVLCERRNKEAKAEAEAGVRAAGREASIFVRGMEAFAAAYGGTMVAWAERLPEDWDQVLNARRNRRSRVWLIVASRKAPRSTDIPLEVPPLDSRGDEIDRIIDEYGADAVAELGGEFTSTDREWVARQPLTHAKIGVATRRAVAYRVAAKAAASRGESRVKVTAIAKLLGISQSTASTWWGRRSSLPALASGIAEAEQKAK